MNFFFVKKIMKNNFHEKKFIKHFIQNTFQRQGGCGAPWQGAAAPRTPRICGGSAPAPPKAPSARVGHPQYPLQTHGLADAVLLVFSTSIFDL